MSNLDESLKKYGGAVLQFVGAVITPFAPYLGAALIAIGAGLNYAAQRRAEREARQRARGGGDRGELRSQALKGNVRSGFEHHALVFGQAQVGGLVAASGTHSPSASQPNYDFYLDIENSITHPGGMEQALAFRIDDYFIPRNALLVDPMLDETDLTDGFMTGFWGGLSSNGRQMVAFLPATTAGYRVVSTRDGEVWTPRYAPHGAIGCAWGAEVGRFAAVGNGVVMTSTDGFFWIARTPAQTYNWTAVAWNGSVFAAVSNTGTGNRVMTSPDGITWTSRSSAADNNWRAIVWAKEIGLFVATATSGTGNRVMTSPDGITWTIRTSAADRSWSSLAWNGSILVAVASDFGSGAATAVMTSPDGITWTSRTAAADSGWSSVTFGGPPGGLVFAACATNAGSVNNVMTSPDGITWTLRSTGSAGALGAIIFSNNQFHAMNSVVLLFKRSVDAITWSERRGFIGDAALSYPCRFHASRGLGAQFADPMLVRNRIDVSTDHRRGIGHSAARFRRPVSDVTLSQVYKYALPTLLTEWKGLRCYDPRKDSTAGGADTKSQTWTTRTPAAANSFQGVAWLQSAGLFALVDASVGGTQHVQTSPDGVTWTLRTAGDGILAICSSPDNPNTGLGGFFQAVRGTNAQALRSSDGITWSTAAMPASVNWKAICYSPLLDQYVAVGDSGTNRAATCSGKGGATWTQRTTVSNQWNGVAWGGGVYVAVASSGTNRVMTSTDGVTWVERSCPQENWKGVCYSPDLHLFAAVASSATGTRVMTSQDGITWTLRSTPEDNLWQAITWNGRNFVAVSTDGTNRVMTSTDGITWVARAAASASSWTCVGSSPTLSIMAASGGQVASSAAMDPMRASDAKTWEWSDNPILHAATYNIMAVSDGGMGVPVDRIDMPSVAAAANICDENKTTPAGTRKRFVGNGVIFTSEKREDNLQRLLDACFGRRVRVGTKYKFYADAYASPTVALDQTWVAGDIVINPKDPLDALYNAVRVNYDDADRDYKRLQAPPYTNSAYETQDGGQRIWADLNLPMVSNSYDAQYLSQIHGKRSRYQMTLQIVCNLKALDVEVNERCTISLPDSLVNSNLSGRVFKVEHWEFTSAGIVLSLREDHASIYTVETMVE